MSKIDFVQLVRQAMDRQGITTNRLAVLLAGKVGRATLYEWLGGKHRMPDDKLAEILDILHIHIHQ